MIKKVRKDKIVMNTENEDISMLAEIETAPLEISPEELENEFPVMTLRNMVMFPSVAMPVTVGRRATLKLVNAALKSKSFIVISTQMVSEVESPVQKDLYPTAVIGKVLRIFEMPGGSTTVILQANGPKVHIDKITSLRPYLSGKVTRIEEDMKVEGTTEFKALMDTCREMSSKFIDISDNLSPDAAFAIKNLENNEMLVNFICSNFPFTVEDKIDLLQINNLKDRLYRLIQILNKEIQLAALKQSIQMRTREELDRQQKEYFLQQQIKNIQDELGNSQDDEIEDLRNKGKEKAWSKEVADIFEREVNKLERINPQSPDYNVQLIYLQTLLALPWETYSTDDINLQNAEKVLNKDHYGLEKVKERILEHLAVLKLKGDLKSPIICLYGPPGVGKTSLGRSIASALKRKYVRMSLGGVHDEAEIRGHRKTYIGAMPGRIIKSLIKAGTSNPVIILDEIDKLGSDHRGDPSSAMLEVLDPEQNNTFHDNYIDMDYDLSKVMFIATANNLGTIPTPLLDRMELIEVSGYITEEKIEIAKRHLIPKEMQANGLQKEHVKFTKAAIEYIIENYTRESGVRELEKKISKVMRKIALEIASDRFTGQHELKPADIKAYLGAPEYSRDKYQGNEYAGVVTGLAWTAVGGEILFVETSLSKGKGGKLTLTGNLGDVMKESAMLALEYLKAHSHLLNLPTEVFDNWNIHIHVPEGAIPKDGPSAGITMVTSLASALTQRKVKPNLAMTGEITLRGKVLPVGGIREKILAAKRAGIKEIILCEENRKDIEEIQPIYVQGLTFHYVKDIKEVLQLSLTNEKVADAIDLSVNEEKEKTKA
ncbi:endopeptidase La [Phocaeicola barnesiae]|jgi:ATP-dependent Lon protease|uniref:Lon protease n=1 Tax=Phocaeicola barnesiae TaxID=376804 RepID=A0AAW5N5H7_9BACT|nr:endopeptidase La [Phocaeicola barnesiae]MBS6468438.1 endopeptidase La [Bacteroides sp.]MCF2576439.1 endopeptidase La [Phocaeicola barnesiae]MCF2597750.1 endopeptidase La [Phocaeicola barnesiae]MCR8873686.1 endopeptidase La [Phocaeicola barnesiae]MDM8232512.1 endopeptidase La [Phocaeicola barnesiae]